jgi:hypothetical protein
MVRRLSLGSSDLRALGAEMARAEQEVRTQAVPGAPILDVEVWATSEPALFAFAWQGPSAHLTTVGWAKVERGTLVLRSLTLRPRHPRARPEINAATLRRVPTEALRASIVAHCSADERLASQWSGYRPARQRQAVRAGSRANWRRGRAESKPGPKATDDTVWQERARAFLDDQAQHGARGYAKRLADPFYVSWRTVQDWKQTAKQKGLLAGTGAVVAPGPRLEWKAGT